MRSVKCSDCDEYRNEWCEKVIDSPHPDMIRDCQYWHERKGGSRMADIKLKPCPFCGGTVSIQLIDPRLYRPIMNHPFAVVCYACDLLFGYDEDYGGRFDSEADAIEAWNRRAERRDDPEEQARVYWCENERYEIPERRENER